MKTILDERMCFSILITIALISVPGNRIEAQNAAPAPEPAKISITGSNGRVAAFLGIKTASAKGITVQMQADGPLIGITWNKLDLAKLKEQHPEIYAAYELAVKEGKPTDLNLGSFEDPAAKRKRMLAKSTKSANGWYEKTIQGTRFVLQMPGGKAKGIIFVAMGDTGESHNIVPRGIPEVGIFGELQKRHQYAIMSYDASISTSRKPGEISDFVLPEKRIGENVLEAIEKISSDSKNTDLATAPIVFYGTGKIGAAFAFNFSQWKPERVIAAVVSNGAFYSQKPTEASAKVPVMFLWGEYNDYPERWGATHRREEIQKEYASLNPHWMDAMEFHGQGYESPLHVYFALEFLGEMIKKRTPEEPGGALADLSDGFWVGDTKTFEISPRTDREKPLGENQTWLPDKEFAEMWKEFTTGKLKLPEPIGN